MEIRDPGRTSIVYGINITGMFPVGDTSCRTLFAVCVCVCVCARACVRPRARACVRARVRGRARSCVRACVCPPTYRSIAPRMIDGFA